MSTKLERIEAALSALQPVHLSVQDESHQHHRGTETHYKAVIASERFAGLSPVKRHQAVYATLGSLMGEVHALALHTFTPEEWERQNAVPASPVCRGGGKFD
jgi:BolA protein